MAEKQIVRLYRRMKSRLLAAIRKDVFFEDFYRLFASGKRTYTLHNTELKKSVDEDWVKAVEKCIPHLERIVASPRKAIKQEENVVPVELAKKVTAASVKHLATNSQYVSKFENGRVTPNKVLNAYNEETLEIYENRFVSTLITRVSQFIDRRYFLLGERGGDEFTSALDLSGTFEQNGEETGYALSLKLHQGADYLGGRGVAASIFERLETVRSYVNSYKSSPFMRGMASAAPVRPPILKTNLLSKDPDYRACVALWDFMDRYDKVGYQIDARETDPGLTEEECAELDALVLFQYLVLKNRLYELDGETQDASFARRRTIKPRFKRGEGEADELYDIARREVLKVNLDGSNQKEVSARLKQAVSQALQLERQKKRSEEAQRKRERAEEERRVSSAIRSALTAEQSKRKAAAREKKQDDRAVYATLSGVLAAERRRKKQREKAAAQAAREREIEAALARTLALAARRKETPERVEKSAEADARAEWKERAALQVARLVAELEENDALIARRREAAGEAAAEQAPLSEDEYLFGEDEKEDVPAGGPPEDEAEEPEAEEDADDLFEEAPLYLYASAAATLSQPAGEEGAPQDAEEEPEEQAAREDDAAPSEPLRAEEARPPRRRGFAALIQRLFTGKRRKG